jgi:alpha-1,2-glucosyltransferase
LNQLRQQQQQEEEEAQQKRQLFWTPFALACLPTHLFFAFLYYTDVPALLFLLATQLLLLLRRPRWAAVAGAGAIAMRQTNTVWVTFMTGAAILEDIYPHRDWKQQQQQQGQEGQGQEEGGESSTNNSQQQQQQEQGVSLRRKEGKEGTSSNSSRAAEGDRQLPGQISSRTQPQQQTADLPLWQELLLVLQQLWLQRWLLLQRYWLLLLLPALFAAFVVWNKGITLGDREAHAPVLHLMQPLYFSLFTLLAAPILLVTPEAVQQLIQTATRAPAATAAVTAAAAGVCVRLVGRYTLEHPYLLADNRHYTFYLWKKIMGRTWWMRYACIPGYLLGWALLAQGLSKARGRLWVLGFMAATVVTLAPAWLLEFR